jgi:hypothetical protein
MGVTAVLRIKAKYAAATKGSETSGNWGHAGRPGQVGGSGPGGAPNVIGKSFYRFGNNPDDTPAEHIYDVSSPEVQELARNIGVIATSDETMEYARYLLKNNQDELISAAKREGGYTKTWISRMKLDDEAIVAKRAELTHLMESDGLTFINKLNMVSRKQFTDAGYDGKLYDKAMEIKHDLNAHPVHNLMDAVVGPFTAQYSAYLEEAKRYISPEDISALNDAQYKFMGNPISAGQIGIAITPQDIKYQQDSDKFYALRKEVVRKINVQLNKEYGFGRLSESDKQQILDMTQKAYIRTQMTGTMGRYGWTKKLLEAYKGVVPKGKINNMSISDMPKVLTAKSMDDAMRKYTANKLGIANFDMHDMSELGGKFTPAEIRIGFGIQPNAMNALRDLHGQDLDAIRLDLKNQLRVLKSIIH